MLFPVLCVTWSQSELSSSCLYWSALILRLDQHWSWHPFIPQLDFVSSFKSLDYGNWYLILNHTVLIKHPNINISLWVLLIVAKWNLLGAPFCRFGLFPEATIPCQHIYVSCNHNNKLSRSQWESGSGICQNCLIQLLNKTPYWQ